MLIQIVVACYNTENIVGVGLTRADALDILTAKLEQKPGVESIYLYEDRNCILINGELSLYYTNRDQEL